MKYERLSILFSDDEVREAGFDGGHDFWRCCVFEDRVFGLRQIVFDDGVVGIMPTMWFL